MGPEHWRYKILEELGRGATSSVHRALDLATGSEAALKSAGGEHAVSLKAEYARLHRLRHPGLVRALDLHLSAGAALLSLELLDQEFPGPGAGRAVPEQAAAAWAGLAAVLGHLHRNGLVHGDIKPENLRGFGLGVKLIDLGLAGSPRPRGSGSFSGTPAYAAPESLEHGEMSPAGDVYSLGLVVWELLGGALPDPGQKADPGERWLENMPDGIGPAAAEILRGMLRHRAYERIGDGAELFWSMAQAGLATGETSRFAMPFAGRTKALRQALAACSSSGNRLMVRSRPGTGRSRFLDELKFLLQLSGKEVLLTADAAAPAPAGAPRDCVLLVDGRPGPACLPGRTVVSLAGWADGPLDSAEIPLDDLSAEEYRAMLPRLLGRADPDDLDRLASWLWRQAGGHVKTAAGLVEHLISRGLLRRENLHWSADWQGILALDTGRAASGAWGPRWDSLDEGGRSWLKKPALSGPASGKPSGPDLEEWTRPGEEGWALVGEAAAKFVADACSEDELAGMEPAAFSGKPSPHLLGALLKAVNAKAWLENCLALNRRAMAPPACPPEHERRRMAGLAPGDLEEALHYSALLADSGLLDRDGFRDVFIQAAGLCRRLARYTRGLELAERHASAVAGDWGMSKAAIVLNIAAGRPGTALELAQGWNDKFPEGGKEKAEAGFLLGSALAVSGDIKLAGETIAAAGASARALGDRGLLVQMHERLASLAQRAGDWEAAARHAREGLELAGADADAEAKEFLILSLGNGLAQTGKPAEAAALLEDFIEAHGGTASLPELGGMHACLGLCRLRLEELDKAIKSLDRAERILWRTGDLRHQAFIISSLAMAHGAAGRHRLEMEKMMEAFHLSKKTGDMHAAAHCLGNAGFKQAALGDRSRARRTLGQALEMASGEGCGQARMLICKHFGLVDYEERKFNESLIWLDKSVTEAKAVGLKPPFETELYRALAALGAGDAARARELARAAAGLAGNRRQEIWAEFAEEMAMAQEGKCDGDRLARSIGEMRERGRPRDAALMALAAAEPPAGPGAAGPWALLPHLVAAEAEFGRLGDRELRERAKEAIVAAARELASGAGQAGGQEMLEAFYQLAFLLKSGAGQAQVGREAVEQAVRLSQAERGGLFIMDEAGRPALLCGVNLDPDTVRDAAEISLQAIGQAARSGREVFSNDAMAEEEFSSRLSVRRNAIRSIACMPLHFREGGEGALYLDSRLMPGLFSEGRRRFLRSLASLAGAMVEASRMVEGLRAAPGRAAPLDAVMGSSPPMLELKERIRRAAPSGVNVLVEGETGTGKELAARAVHGLSPRAGKPFVALDCGSLPEGLLESELFGCAKGAFTGAHADKPGLIEAADGGTLFLDEITGASQAVQARLLRVIEEGEIRRVGENRPRRVDVRLICAANKDMEFEVGEGRFKQDLYFRMNEFRITVPPLRDRGGDVLVLAEHFRRRHQRRHGRRGLSFTPGARKAMARHPWPGNIRELDNAVQRAVIMNRDGRITEQDLELPSCAGASGTKAPYGQAQVQRSTLVSVLRDLGNDTAKAAEKLGISRRQVQRLMRKYRIAT